MKYAFNWGGNEYKVLKDEEGNSYYVPVGMLDWFRAPLNDYGEDTDKLRLADPNICLTCGKERGPQCPNKCDENH